MKVKILSMMVLAGATFITQHASAIVWRVNSNANANNGSNLGGTPGYPVFTQLTDAIASNLISETAGDTIHLEGSTIPYAGTTVTKKLVIIGAGYFLTKNPNTSNNVLDAQLNDITFNAGSEGSQLIGVNVYGFYGITINVSNVIIKRCFINKSITLANEIADISVLQNYFANLDNNNTSAIVANYYGFPTNFIFNNNISKKTLILVSNTTTDEALECKNNVFDCPSIVGNPSIRLNTGSFQNNILKTAAATVNINDGTNLNVTYNTGSIAGQFGTSDNNIVVADMSTLFVTADANKTDANYQLKPGSAIGSDLTTERGAFGGLAVTNRYTLSGLAPIPVIYNISTAGVATPTGLQVSIKARIIK